MKSRDEIIAARRARHDGQARELRKALARAGITFDGGDSWPHTIVHAVRLLQSRSLADSGRHLLEKMRSTLGLHYFIESASTVYIASFALDADNYGQGVRVSVSVA